MKKISLLLLALSCSVLALENNPIAPPKVEIADQHGVNVQSLQLARNLNTVSIGGELGLSHHVQLYTDLFAEGDYYGYVDAFAGTVARKNISQNIVTIAANANGDPMYFRDWGTHEIDHTKRVSVVRAYGPAGTQDFLVYQNGVVDSDASSAFGPDYAANEYTFKAVGDTRHSLIESADKRYRIWITPDGIESKYSREGMRLVEVTYPNGYKVRVAYKGVTTNTGFMLKYQLDTQVLNGTPHQIVAINLANQYCSADAAACSTTGWPTATFTWPVGTPSNFWTPGLPSSSYLVTLATPAGVTEIQYQPANMCITNAGYEDMACSGSRTGLGKWSPRLRSIKTPESTTPNYQYTYENIGTIVSVPTGTGSGTYWYNTTRVGQIVTATLNGTDEVFYGGPTVNPDLTTTYSSKNDVTQIRVQSPPNSFNVISSVNTKEGGRYVYHTDLRHFVEKYYPVAGRGPALHYYYEGPRGNLNKIHMINSSDNETLFQEASYSPTCDYPKTCNKPLWVKDARGNITNYDYDPQGRFSNPIKITAPADKNGKRAATIYNYEYKHAYYKRNGETITQDPDPVWMLTSEHTCRTSEATSTGCASGNSLDMVKTSYYYGPQSTAQANNLLLRGKSVVAEGGSGVLETRVWCYEYDKYGKLIGETSPKGNSTNLQSCQ